MLFSRSLSGIWGIVSFIILTVVLLTILVLFELPPSIVWGGGLLAVTLLLLQVVSALRGSVRRQGAFSAFTSNALGNPVAESFQAPYHNPLPFDSTESALLWCAPILQVAGNFADLFKGGTSSFLGKGKTMDAENAVILTQKRLLFLMIGPDSLRRFCPGAKIVDILDNLPGDASQKRRMLRSAGTEEVCIALKALLETESLEQVAQTHFSFTIPLAHITAFEYSADKQMIHLQLNGINLHYSFTNREDAARLAVALARQVKVGNHS